MSYQKSDPTDLTLAKFLLYNENKAETKIDLGNSSVVGSTTNHKPGGN